MKLLLLLAAVVGLVVGIVLEGRRQSRKLGRKASGSPNALGTALLEAQGMLEPERKVEWLQQELRGEDRVEVEHDQEAGDGQESGDDPESGS